MSNKKHKNQKTVSTIDLESIVEQTPDFIAEQIPLTAEQTREQANKDLLALFAGLPVNSKTEDTTEDTTDDNTPKPIHYFWGLYNALEHIQKTVCSIKTDIVKNVHKNGSLTKEQKQACIDKNAKLFYGLPVFVNAVISGKLDYTSNSMPKMAKSILPVNTPIDNKA